MKKVKLLVFDLDGTLVDGPLNFGSLREELNIEPEAPILEHVDSLDCLKKREHYHQRIKDIEKEAALKARPKKFASQVLKSLKERSFHLAIWTRNSNEATHLSLRDLGPYFSHIQTRESCIPKPSTQGMFTILSLFNLEAHEALYVGDSHFDIQAGPKAGVKTLILKNDRLGKLDPIPPKVTLIDDLQEVLDHL